MRHYCTDLVLLSSLPATLLVMKGASNEMVLARAGDRENNVAGIGAALLYITYYLLIMTLLRDYRDSSENCWESSSTSSR